MGGTGIRRGGSRVAAVPSGHLARRAAAGGDAAWEQVQRTGVAALYRRGLVHGGVYAVDGSGIGPDLRVVALVCVSGSGRSSWPGAC